MCAYTCDCLVCGYTQMKGDTAAPTPAPGWHHQLRRSKILHPQKGQVCVCLC